MEEPAPCDALVPSAQGDWSLLILRLHQDADGKGIQAVLSSCDRYECQEHAKGYRNGCRKQEAAGTFSKLAVSLLHAGLMNKQSCRKRGWRSQTIRACRRLARRIEVVTANTYLAGTNKRPVRQALINSFGGAVFKDTVSQAWRVLQRCNVHKERNLLTHAPENTNEECKRRIMTKFPLTATAAMLLWALTTSGQNTMCRIEAWQSLDQAQANQPLDRAA